MNNIETVQSFLNAYSAHDIDRMLKLCSATSTFRYVPEGEKGKGSMQDAAELWQLFTTAFPDFSVEIQQLIKAEDNKVIAETIQGGTQAKDVGEIKNKGHRTWCPHLYIFDLDEQNQIDHITCFWDYNTIYRQLGHTETHD